MVIGGAGFIGSHLVDRLLAEDHEVDVLDDLSTGHLSNLAGARAAGGSLKIHHLDAASVDADTLIGMRTPDVIHLLSVLRRPDQGGGAAASGFGVAANTLEAARRHGVAKVIATLPASVLYGHPAVQALPVKEGSIVPRGVRGVVARATVDLMETYRELHQVEFTALAMASVYGPRQRSDAGVVAAFCSAVSDATQPVLHGDGRQTRDLLFIDDAVDALVRANERGGGLLVNVGTGVQTSMRELWDRVGAGSGISAQTGPSRPDDVARFAVSSVRARIHLAWSPWTDLDEGLARTRSEQSDHGRDR
jgi:UDP-glucose 4-epimerase